MVGVPQQLLRSRRSDMSADPDPSQPDEQPSPLRDDLLSVNDVARLWGTGLTAVARSVDVGEVLSLDRGLLIAEGRYDVPVIRRSWAEAPRRDSPGASRILHPPSEAAFHPAVETAFDFHKALDLDDAGGVSATSTAASCEGRTPDELLGQWQRVGSHLLQPDAGVGTTVYSLAPLDAVAARIIADAPALPRAVTKPTPATMIDALPLVLEEDSWRVDLPLFERREEWIHLLTSPPPDSEGGSESTGSSSPAGPKRS